MHYLSRLLTVLFVSMTIGIGTSFADNQTADLSPINSAAGLPFRITIEQTPWELPEGFHSGVVGIYKEFWVLIAGRTNGLHGFTADNFPVEAQNTKIFVVNSLTGAVASRSLLDSSSGLNQQQIDTLSVTSPQGYQVSQTLYMTGGYGIDTSTATFSTKPVLTAFNLPGIVNWVLYPDNTSFSVRDNISQLYDPTFQITGGKMSKIGDVTQLVFGQNFIGPYTDGSNGIYSEQVRRFRIKTIKPLSVEFLPARPAVPDPNFRRRDLNVVPVIFNNQNDQGLVAYAGVFTPGNNAGVWTVPVTIRESSDPQMADPNLPTTFKQGMNQYVSAITGLYSRRYESMYNIVFGGLSYEYFSNGALVTDAEIPFLNQVTTIKMDKNGLFTQYIMDNEYPVILSTQVNPGNPFYFGAGANFIPHHTIRRYANGVINLDNIRTTTVLGYIVGGIKSTLQNTNSRIDSSASAYVFKVTLVPQRPTVQ